MTYEERTEWLDALKVGDVVVCDFSPSHTSGNWKVGRIKTITPTRRFKITFGSFESAFDTRGADRSERFHHTQIEPLTDAIKLNIERYRLQIKLTAMKWAAVELDTLRKIATLLDEVTQ